MDNEVKLAIEIMALKVNEAENKGSVIQKGMWDTIKAIHSAYGHTASLAERLAEHVRPEFELQAAEIMDKINASMNSCDKLVAPMRKIMEDYTGD